MGGLVIVISPNEFQFNSSIAVLKNWTGHFLWTARNFQTSAETAF